MIYNRDDYTPTIENIRQKSTENRLKKPATLDELQNMEGMESFFPKHEMSNTGYIDPLTSVVRKPILGNPNSYPSTDTYNQPIPLSLDEIAEEVSPTKNISGEQFYVKDGNSFTNFPKEGYTPYQWKNTTQILPNGDKLYAGSNGVNWNDIYKFNNKTFKVAGEKSTLGNFGVGNQGVFAGYDKDSTNRKPLISPNASYEEKVAARYKVMNDPKLSQEGRQYVLNKYGLTDIKLPETKEVSGVLYERQPGGSFMQKTPNPKKEVASISEKDIYENAIKIFTEAAKTYKPKTWVESLEISKNLAEGKVPTSTATHIEMGKANEIPTLDSEKSIMDDYIGR